MEGMFAFGVDRPTGFDDKAGPDQSRGQGTAFS